MATEFAVVPTIDLTPLSTEVPNDEIKTETLSEISRQVMDAFRTTGFLYLKNSGLTAEEVRQLNQIVGDFFREPVEYKEKYARGHRSDRSHGWIPVRDFSNIAVYLYATFVKHQCPTLQPLHA